MARQIAVFLIAFTVFCRIIYFYAPTHDEENIKANRLVRKVTDFILFASSVWLIATYVVE